MSKNINFLHYLLNIVLLLSMVYPAGAVGQAGKEAAPPYRLEISMPGPSSNLPGPGSPETQPAPLVNSPSLSLSPSLSSSLIRALQEPVTIAWISQFGTSSLDHALSVCVDGAGNIYVAGYTSGAFPGQSNLGSYDAYLRKYDAIGNEVWTRQFGTSFPDDAWSVCVDGAGNIYVAGYISGALPGQSSSGYADAYLRKYDAMGNEVWTRQFGTSSNDYARSVFVDGAGNIYVAGWTYGAFPGQINLGSQDTFLRKYDAIGNEVWTRQFGTFLADHARSVFVDGAGNIYVAGWTYGAFPGQSNLGGSDAYLRKYDAMGNEVWTRQFGTSFTDYAYSVSVDGAGNIYVAGSTNGFLPGQSYLGGHDAYLRKYNSAGSEAWTRQFGTSLYDYAVSVSADGAGNIYVAGYTDGALPGQSNLGGKDVYLRKYDSAGSEAWTRQFGTSDTDYAWSVSVDGVGNIYVAGHTFGALPGQSNLGGYDAFLIKFAQAPVDNTPPPAPTPASPADGSMVNTAMPTFNWSAVADDSPPVLYDLQVATNSAMITPLINKTNLDTNSYTLSLSESLSPGTWYWIVRARDSASSPNYSAWSSPPWSFTVIGLIFTLPITASFFSTIPDSYGVKLDMAIAELNSSSTTGSLDDVDIPDPPNPAEAPFMDIEFLPGPLTTDSRPLSGSPASATWTFRVRPTYDETGATPVPVTLTWNLASANAATIAYLLALQDMITSTIINLRASPNYIYTGTDSLWRNFTLYARANQPPSVTILYPNGGETLAGITTISAQVSEPDALLLDYIAAVNFYYASAPYTTWYPIGLGTPASGTPASGTWSVPWNTLQVPEGSGYRVRAVAADILGAIGIDESDAGFTILHKIFATATWDVGWVMWSYPFLPDPNTHSGQLGDNVSPLWVFHYNAKKEIYDITYAAMPGSGYWTKVNVVSNIDMEGIPIITPTFEIPLGSSWNQIGHPYNATVAWGNVLLRKDVVTRTLLEANSAGWVNQWLYNYNTASGVYETRVAANGVMRPGVGYWMKANQAGVTLIIPSS